jgi:hypothetical protein
MIEDEPHHADCEIWERARLGRCWTRPRVQPGVCARDSQNETRAEVFREGAEH